MASETPITEVLGVLEQHDINHIPVTQDGRLLGMIIRDHLVRVLYANLELGAHKGVAFRAEEPRTEPDVNWRT